MKSTGGPTLWEKLRYEEFTVYVPVVSKKTSKDFTLGEGKIYSAPH